MSSKFSFAINLTGLLLSVIVIHVVDLNFQALESNQPVVTFEVILSVQRLISNFGYQLHDPEWDIIITILQIIISQVGMYLLDT